MRAKRCERQCRAACARLLGDSDHPSLNLDISELIFLLLTHMWGDQSCAWHNCQPGLGAPGAITSAWPWQGSSSTLLVWHRRPHPSSPVSITPQPRPHGAVLFLPDVDECAGRSHGCSQLCVNTAGSFRCACRDGFSLAADHKACQPAGLGPGPGTFSQAGPSNEMKEEMKDLKSRVEALEEKLQLVLAPFHNLVTSEPEDVGADPISRLSHSLQQLDRIDSLSEQISFLEERLETCSCKNEL
ncbi:Epidermal growth factor-like protein 7 [Aix galericulata]|nr:Epidermal growth factor-like protein 7 [Aix galericulata]